MIDRRPYRGRKACALENDRLRVTVLEGGGHIAEFRDKRSGLNPLWTPIWPSVDPWSTAAASAAYGTGPEARLLAGILGHNVCLDLFGGPSAEEAAAGLTVHGEAPVVRHAIADEGDALVAHADLPLAQLRFERRISLHGSAARIHESVDNLSAYDRPVGWTQHVTLGPPFLEKGVTDFRCSATRSQVYAGRFGDDDYLQPGATFDWPMAPLARGGTADLRRFTDAPASSAYTAHLMDPARAHACFVAFCPRAELAFGYVWRRADFPWLGIWEENLSRRQPPWNGETLTRGMEFGVSPFPETRRQMVERGPLFGTPTCRWIPAHTRISVEYWAIAHHSRAVPETLDWP